VVSVHVRARRQDRAPRVVHRRRLRRDGHHHGAPGDRAERTTCVIIACTAEPDYIHTSSRPPPRRGYGPGRIGRRDGCAGRAAPGGSGAIGGHWSSPPNRDSSIFSAGMDTNKPRCGPSAPSGSGSPSCHPEWPGGGQARPLLSVPEASPGLWCCGPFPPAGGRCPSADPVPLARADAAVGLRPVRTGCSPAARRASARSPG
jgi:hypothetical protein